MTSLGAFNISLSAVDTMGTTSFTGMSIIALKPFDIMDFIWTVPVVLITGIVVFFGKRRMANIKVKKGFQEQLGSKESRMIEIDTEKKNLQDEFLQTRITESAFKEKMKALDTEYQKLDIEIKELKNNEIE
jgi:septal ring factor EnvC (AmiA/AmiB activator)